MNDLHLPKDIINICFSYLYYDEQLYYKNEWNKFKKNDVYIVASRCGFIDLLEWGIKNECRWCKLKILECAAQFNQMKIFEWFIKNNFDIKSYYLLSQSKVCTAAA